MGSYLGKLFLPNFKVKVRKRGKGRYTGRSARRVQERLTDNRSTFVQNSVTQLRRSRGRKTWLAFLDLRKASPCMVGRAMDENDKLG